MSNKTLEDKYLSIILDNDNVSETNDLKEFFILVSAFFLLFFALFLSVDYFANIYISNMSAQQEIKLERLLSISVKKPPLDPNSKYSKKMKYAEMIKNKLIARDENLQNKSDFNLGIINDKNINAFVGVDGNIYFTSGLLDEVNTVDEFAFVIAHELGHYSKRHHLKAFSKGVSMAIIASIASVGQSNGVKNSISGLINFTKVKYSREQEKEADLYASVAIKDLYGTNRGAIRFFKRIEQKENHPEFLYLFSTHPHPKDRIRLIEEN